jgi:hypothetical protein
MKGTSKNLKGNDVKNENENSKETEANGSSTPEISARSRQSLDGFTAQREDEKEAQIQQLQALLQEQSQQLENDPSDEKNILKIFSHLTNVLKETTMTDVNMPPKFNGYDNHWEAWSKQWRAYLQAKEWLTTAEHPEGPGAIGFDLTINANLTINAKIYNCLVNLCRKGKAITYVEQATEFDGYGANKQLLLRYDGFSKQKLQSLKKCVEMLKHISGTNITHHIDKFEKFCGQMVNCGFTPTEEEKIDWFLASIHERTYEAMHAHCINLQLQDTLTF